MDRIPLLGPRPEDDLLSCCAVMQCDSGIAARIDELLNLELNWHYLIWKSFRFDLLPLLYHELYPAHVERIPRPIRGMLSIISRGILVFNMVLAAEILKITQLLAAEGIPSMAIKGPASVAFIYENLALQRSNTPGLLINPEDQGKARLLLSSQGYNALPQSDGIILITDRMAAIKLCWELASPFYPVALDLAKLWPGKIRIPFFDDKAVFSMGGKDLILSLCEQGAKNTWSRLKHVLDLSRLIGKHPAMDWDQILTRARTLNCERILLTGLLLANKLLGTAPPAEVLSRATAMPGLKAETDKAKDRILNLRSSDGRFAAKYMFQLRMKDRLPDRIRHGLKMTPEICKEYLHEPLKRLIIPQPERVTFAPTPQEVVEHMLDMAQVGPEDLVYDIGSGDGRIVITAARRYGARGLGIDIDPERIAQSKARAREEGVAHLVSFVCEEAARIDLSPATVVTLFMTPSMNQKLRPRLWQQLQSGARIISRHFDFGNCPPHEIKFAADGKGGIDPLYLWRK